MPFSKTNDYLTGRKPIPTPAGIEVVATRFALDVATADLAANTIGQIGVLPAGCEPVALYVDCTAGETAMVLQLGLLDETGLAFSAAPADGGGAWGQTQAAVATAAQQQVLSQPMTKVTQSQVDRKLGMKVLTAPSAPVVGTIGVTLFYHTGQ